MSVVSVKLSRELFKKTSDYCWENRITKSNFLRSLVEEWAGRRENQELCKVEGLATDTELREAVAAGIVSAEDVGLK